MIKRLFIVMAVSMISTLYSSAVAQRMPSTSVTPRDRSVELKQRSAELERVRRDAAKPEKRMEPSFPQIKEDFERIQIINSEVLQAKPSSDTLDYKRISNAAAEIKKRAGRLKSNLFPSDLEKSEKAQEKEEQDLKLMLKSLDDAIAFFTHNPIFLNTKVVDPKDSEQAQRDLEMVIKLSGKIKKEADRLKKE